MVDFADFTAEKTRVRRAVEDYLTHAFNAYPGTEVREAARYAALGGGHRWRAMVAVAAGRMFRDDALDVTLPAACSAELAHAASLVLDDLPSMDDAGVRRGKPCTHLVFPRWAVDMTPVFLVTMSYQMSLANPRASEERRVRAALELTAAGIQMIAGQSTDIRQEHVREKSRLLECYKWKSGVLYAAAAKVGAILCGANGPESQSAYDAGLNLGLSYQVLDDVADVVAGLTEIGKKPGMDAGKWTAVDWLGVDGARQKSRELQAKGLAALEGFDAKADWLRTLVCEASYELEAS